MVANGGVVEEFGYGPRKTTLGTLEYFGEARAAAKR